MSIERKSMASKLRKMKSPLFSTPNTIDELIEQHNIKGEAAVAVMMAVNTVLELIAGEIENGNLR